MVVMLCLLLIYSVKLRYSVKKYNIYFLYLDKVENRNKKVGLVWFFYCMMN